MTLKAIRFGLAIVGCLLVGVVAIASFVATRQQVLSQLHAINPAASITPSGIHPSKTFGIYLSYDIHGDSELSYAYWRLLPSPHVEFTK
jgi:hypothetical protein